MARAMQSNNAGDVIMMVLVTSLESDTRGQEVMRSTVPTWSADR